MFEGYDIFESLEMGLEFLNYGLEEVFFCEIVESVGEDIFLG